MGSGASKRNIVGISKEDHLLYSPALLDLQHGTIRHRDKELASDETIRQGYFYHAQLPDWTDDNCIKDFQKKHVVSAANTNKLFYVYAVGLDTDVEDTGIQKVRPKPKGLGYRWRGNSQYRYFRLRFSKRREDEDSDSEKEEIRASDTIHRIHPKEGLTAHSLSEIVGMKMLIPSYRIRIIYQTSKLEPDTNIASLNPDCYRRCKLELKIIADVEIVKQGYDADEPASENTFMIKQDLSISSAGSDQNSALRDETLRDETLSDETLSDAKADIAEDQSGSSVEVDAPESNEDVLSSHESLRSPIPGMTHLPRHSSPLPGGVDDYVLSGTSELSQVLDVNTESRDTINGYAVQNSDSPPNVNSKENNETDRFHKNASETEGDPIGTNKAGEFAKETNEIDGDTSVTNEIDADASGTNETEEYDKSVTEDEKKSKVKESVEDNFNIATDCQSPAFSENSDKDEYDINDKNLNDAHSHERDLNAESKIPTENVTDLNSNKKVLIENQDDAVVFTEKKVKSNERHKKKKKKKKADPILT